MDIFSLMGLGMADNYDERMIDRYEADDLTISTASVDDTEFIETAVSHMDYNGGDWIAVENSKTEEEAKKAHKKWIGKMTTEPLPEELKDVSEAPALKLGEEMFGKEELRKEFTFPRIRKED